MGKKMCLSGSSRFLRSELVVNAFKVLYCNCQHANAAILSCQLWGMDRNTRAYWVGGGFDGELERTEL